MSLPSLDAMQIGPQVGSPPLWEGPNRKAIGPISWRSAEADVIAFAERHADRRISLREIALSHSRQPAT